MSMRTIIPGEIPVPDMHQFLLGCVAPRPIAFVSTVDEQGRQNLAPYSFFNAFSSNPPIVVFSSNRTVRDNTTKDTLHNIRATGECVINVVSYNIVRQMAVASVQFEPGISEFEKSGLTPIAADLVAPARVKESPAHLECRLKEIITLGEHGGAGHLIICDVVRMHVSEDVITENDRIDPDKMDLMGRMGRAYYVRASGTALHTIVQPVLKIPVGYNALPASARNSRILTGNALGRLAGAIELPTAQDLEEFAKRTEIQPLLHSDAPVDQLHLLAMQFLERDAVNEALQAVMLADQQSDS